MTETLLSNTCTSAGGTSSLDVCVPVQVTPRAVVGAVTVTCNGNPEITDEVACSGNLNGSYTFYLRQNLILRLPVTFSASAVASGIYVGGEDPTPVTPAEPVIIHSTICSDH